ncbi:MAG: ATP-binding cassette domain-containing protein [Paenibacillaceae bacterium]|nr:ATP-binding cassette domain-containing protein [Paenibacillaceae bacterium]
MAHDSATFFFRMERASVDYVDGRSGRYALCEASCAIDRGSWTCVAGGNGSGKSTFAKALAGILPLTSGTLERSGVPHLVLQQPESQLLGSTVEEELAVSLRQPPDPAAWPSVSRELLRQAGLRVAADAEVRHLSGGQKQLLNIASCLAADAEAIVFDEATSMLDPGSRQAVLDTAVRLHRAGKTIVWVTHRMEELGYGERVLVLTEGRLVYDGMPDRFFYERTESGTPCERFGFEPPYVVRVAEQLHRRNVMPAERPLFPSQLAHAMEQLCLSN